MANERALMTAKLRNEPKEAAAFPCAKERPEGGCRLDSPPHFGGNKIYETNPRTKTA
jgi:hypothetical protein